MENQSIQSPRIVIPGTDPESSLYASVIPIFFSFLIFILLGLTGFLYYQNQQLSQQIAILKATPTPSPTNTPGNLGSCVPVYKVETNTQELTAKQNYSLYCSEKRSEADCLSVDVYNQKLDVFSSPDGSPDCKWNKPIPSPPSAEGTFCGGIAGVTCPKGYLCKYDGKYPDAGGLCSKR